MVFPKKYIDFLLMPDDDIIGSITMDDVIHIETKVSDDYISHGCFFTLLDNLVGSQSKSEMKVAIHNCRKETAYQWDYEEVSFYHTYSHKNSNILLKSFINNGFVPLEILMKHYNYRE